MPAEALNAPSIHYAAILPMLILFGTACLGVIVEAALPRRGRFRVQFLLAVAGLIAALVTVFLASDITAGGSIVIDGPGLFLQGAIIVLGLVSLLLISDRTLEHGGPFVAHAAVTANTEADRQQAAQEAGATEVYP